MLFDLNTDDRGILDPVFDVCIVGAGPAGTRCALGAAKRLPGARVTLAGAEPALPYDRVALSKYVAGAVEQEALITHSLADLAAVGVAYRAGTAVASLDLAEFLLASGQADLVMMGRALLRDPFWPIRAAKEAGVEVDFPIPTYARATGPFERGF